MELSRNLRTNLHKENNRGVNPCSGPGVRRAVRAVLPSPPRRRLEKD